MAEAIAAAATNVPGVAGLAGGKFGQIATYAPGRKVNGVRFAGDAVEVHLVAEWVESLPQLADDVRAALDTLTCGAIGQRVRRRHHADRNQCEPRR